MIASIMRMATISSVVAIAAIIVLPSAWADETIDVVLKDKGMESMEMVLSTDTVKAGKVTFNITSQSQELVHEFVVTRSDLEFDAVPFEDAEHNEVDEDKLNVIDEAEDIDPGKTKTLDVNLEPGRYLLICNEPGHYKTGMRAVLTVTP